jgi:phage-related holin
MDIRILLNKHFFGIGRKYFLLILVFCKMIERIVKDIFWTTEGFINIKKLFLESL